MAEKEYIEREALLADNLMHTLPMSCGRASGRVVVFFDDIESIPAADVVEVRHARWKDNHCTACGMMPMGEEMWDSCEFAPPKFEFFMDFCPCCGAKMDGGSDDV
jgi:hypothetical protein